MKKFTLGILVILLVTAGMAHAQDDMKISAGVKAGWYWFQDEPISDFIEDNWIVGGDVIVWFGNGFGVGAEALYLDGESDVISHGGFDVVTEFTQIPVSANAYFALPMDNDMLKVYIGAGVTYVFTDLSTATVDNSISFDSDDSVFGFNGLVALQFGNFFAEGKYLWAEPELTHAAAGMQEMPVSGFSLMGGVRF